MDEAGLKFCSGRWFEVGWSGIEGNRFGNLFIIRVIGMSKELGIECVDGVRANESNLHGSDYGNVGGCGGASAETAVVVGERCGGFGE